MPQNRLKDQSPEEHTSVFTAKLQRFAEDFSRNKSQFIFAADDTAHEETNERQGQSHAGGFDDIWSHGEGVGVMMTMS